MSKEILKEEITNNQNLNQSSKDNKNESQWFWLLISTFVFCGTFFGFRYFEGVLFRNLADKYYAKNESKKNVIEKQTTFDLIKKRFLLPLGVIFLFVITCLTIYLTIKKLTKKPENEDIFPFADKTYLASLDVDDNDKFGKLIKKDKKFFKKKMFEADLLAIKKFQKIIKMWLIDKIYQINMMKVIKSKNDLGKEYDKEDDVKIIDEFVGLIEKKIDIKKIDYNYYTDNKKMVWNVINHHVFLIKMCSQNINNEAHEKQEGEELISANSGERGDREENKEGTGERRPDEENEESGEENKENEDSEKPEAVEAT